MRTLRITANSTVDISFVTENDTVVGKCEISGRYFLSSYNFKTVKLWQKPTYMGVMLRLAKLEGVKPLCMQMFRVDFRDGLHVVGERVELHQLGECIKELGFLVRIVPWNGDQNLYTVFQVRFQDIREAEEAQQRYLGTDFPDSAHFCSVGSSSVLEAMYYRREPLFPHHNSVFQHLLKEMQDLLMSVFFQAAEPPQRNTTNTTSTSSTITASNTTPVSSRNNVAPSNVPSSSKNNQPKRHVQAPSPSITFLLADARIRAWQQPGHSPSTIDIREGFDQRCTLHEITTTLRALARVPVDCSEEEQLSKDVFQVASDCAFGIGADILQLTPVISEGVHTSTISPAYPVVVTRIHNSIVTAVLTAHTLASELATVTTSNTHNGLQQLSYEDGLLLQGLYPSVESMTLSVFSFTLVDNCIRPAAVDPSTPSLLPFVTYARQDDTYDSLVRRLADHTGESTHDILPVVVRDGEAELILVGEEGTLWDTLLALSDGCALHRHDRLRDTPLTDDVMVYVGIQRAVTPSDLM